MSRAMCLNFCALNNYRYAAVKNSGCYCDDSDDIYNKYGQANESECDIPCSGNASEMCGGEWTQNIFLGNVKV